MRAFFANILGNGFSSQSYANNNDFRQFHIVFRDKTPPFPLAPLCFRLLRGFLNLANEILTRQRRSSLLPCLLAGIFRLIVELPHSRLDILGTDGGVRRVVPMLAERAMPHAIVFDIV